MKQTYVIAHWVLTLLLSPVTSQVIQYIWGTNPHQVVGLLEIYPIAVLFSVVFSIPTFLVYLTCFYFLSKQGRNLVMSKTILIAVSVLGIYVTQRIIKGTMSQDIIITYSITSIIVGLMLRLRDSKKKTESNPIAT